MRNSSFGHVSVIRGADILNSTADSIVVTTNCVGVMGAGLALQAAKRYPGLNQAYQAALKRGHHGIGKPFRVAPVVLFATKRHYRNRSRLADIRASLEAMVRDQHLYGDSIALPPLGCGLGGLDFQRDLRPLLIELLPQFRCKIVLYLPK